MKRKDTIHRSILLIYPVIFLLFLFACKKDSDNPILPVPVFEHVTEILGLKGGYDDYKEIYNYEGEQLSNYYIYRPGKEGEWKDWLRYTYEYLPDDLIVEIREGYADSVWFLANRNEKKYNGENLIQMIQYEYDQGSPGNWRPVKKIDWTYDGDRLSERMTCTYPDNNWEMYSKAEYEYEGSLWTGLKSYRYNNGHWDTTACVFIIYTAGVASMVDVYECGQNGVWTLEEQYLLHYNGSLISEMEIYQRSGDSLKLEQTISVTYTECGHPSMYMIDYVCCPKEEIHMTYVEGKGNFQLATRAYSNHMRWPWFPAPVK